MGPCRTVQDIKVHTSRRFPEFFPPEVIVLDEKCIAQLENQLPAPMRVKILLQGEDRTQRFWELAFEDFSTFGDLERASRCLEEVNKLEPEYESRKLLESAEMGETLECKIQYERRNATLVQEYIILAKNVAGLLG